jgi:hypothetical protein
MTTINQNERKVLDVLLSAGDYYLPFAPICEETGLERRVVRRACRALARKGMTEFRQGLWNEDGEPAGSGYKILPPGVGALQR